MSQLEAAYFYNDFSDLFAEINAAELFENIEATSAHKEILSCSDTQSDL